MCGVTTFQMPVLMSIICYLSYLYGANEILICHGNKKSEEIILINSQRTANAPTVSTFWKHVREERKQIFILIGFLSLGKSDRNGRVFS